MSMLIAKYIRVFVSHCMYTVPLATRKNQYQFVATRCLLRTQNDDARSRAYHNHTKRTLLHFTSFTAVSDGKRMSLCLRLLLRTPFTVIRRMTQIQIARTLAQRNTYVSTRHVREHMWTVISQPVSQSMNTRFLLRSEYGCIERHKERQKKSQQEAVDLYIYFYLYIAIKKYKNMASFIHAIKCNCRNSY